MAWEDNKGAYIFLLVLLAFIIFCAIMAVRSAKKQKASGETPEQRAEKQKNRNSAFGTGFIIFLAAIWFASAVLILALYRSGNLPPTIQIPRLMALPYELLGITGGALVQMVASLAVIIGVVVSAVKKKAKRKASETEEW